MADDCRISTALPRHPKTVKLHRRLGAQGCWSLICLFLWVADNRSDGSLQGLTDEDIEIAADWSDPPGEFVRTLKDVHFLDGDVGSYSVHDWREHNLYVATRQQRVEAARAAVQSRWKNTPPEQRSDAARQAANARWAREKNDACDMPTDAYSPYAACAPTPPHLTSTHHTTEKPKPCSGAGAPPLPGWIPADAWSGFVEMRKKIRAPLTDRAMDLTIKRLSTFKDAGEDVGAILDQSTQHDWKGVFSLKGSNNGNGKANRAEERLNSNLAACAAVKRDFGLVS